MTPAAAAVPPIGVPPAAVAVALALALDLSVAEFPRRVHPVALFGRAVAAVDRPWSNPRAAGALIALSLPPLAAAVAGGLVVVAARANPAAGVALAGLALFSATSLRMLCSVAAEVIDLTERDVEAARGELRALAGRDAGALSAGEIRSAAAESAAENLADGLVAPLLAFALGAQVSLAGAVAAAVWVKAVNTLDSMLGYRSKPVGWASARLDDAVMWVPARSSAALIALAAGDLGALGRAREWARAPPSPNSGWPMATLAAALDVELRKPGVYDLNPAAALPTAAKARRGVRLVGIAGLLAFLGAAGVTFLPEVVTWS